jgi:hypothetical protein
LWASGQEFPTSATGDIPHADEGWRSSEGAFEPSLHRAAASALYTTAETTSYEVSPDLLHEITYLEDKQHREAEIFSSRNNGGFSAVRLIYHCKCSE